jgi:DNA-binding CsgD family transcriptional regulator/N-acetylneuraminic acid mutarotase
MTSPEPTELSERELEILRLVATGVSNKEIAQKLYISSNTVKVHLRNIFTKIGVNSRTEAAMYAVRTGLVINPINQVIGEKYEDNTSGVIGKGYESKPLPIGDDLVLSSSRKLPRWAALILFLAFVGLIFLGWRLSPGLALFTKPTALPPKNTVTPIPHWKNLTALPIARSNLALTAFGNQIYAIGGLSSQGVYDGVDRFDTQTNTWTTSSPKLTPVFDAQAAVINGLIYVPGGRLTTMDLQPTNILEIYDTSSNQWKTGATLPIPLSGYGLVAFEGHLYVFGGWDGKKYHNSVYSYDPTTDIWKIHTPMPTARAFPGAAEAGGKIYIIGGINENLSVNVNEIYTPSRDHDNLNPWETGFPIPDNRLGIQAATIADTIYVFGGEILHSNRSGLIYFPQTDVWQSLEASPTPLGENFGMSSIGTNLFFVGGNFGSVYSDQNRTYQAIITLSIPIIIK